MRQKIIPHLWYDKEAKEAAELYVSVFKGAKITGLTEIHDTPSGTVPIVSFQVRGLSFQSISAGPYFKFNPSVSFLVACRTEEEVEAIWKRIADGGSALMDLASYPFSKKYGWCEDRYGLSWQVMFMGDRPVGQSVIPTMMFVGHVCGKAEEAVNFYASVFRNARVGEIDRYGKEEGPDKPGTVRHVAFTLEGLEFAAMDSALDHRFAFNEAISFMVHCDTQTEIDRYWDLLTADPAAEQCGWLKDKYGLSWQIVPTVLDEMLGDKDQGKVARVTEAFLKMKKFDIAALRKAYGP
jgi:predicted 3-demethylubiquinone-9 3-methyltransferase (glyoxalase superfamily)